MTTYDKDNLPTGTPRLFRKTTLTPMWRISGPFTVRTKEGMLTCPDGWLAVDTAGYPYPVAKRDHDDTYEETDAAQQLRLDWDDGRIFIVGEALETYIAACEDPETHGNLTGYQVETLLMAAAEARGALEDIRKSTT